MTSPVDDGGEAGKESKRRTLRVAKRSDDPRPEILMRSDVHLVTEAMTSALRVDPELYQRNGELVHVVRHDDGEDRKHAIGTPIVRGAPLSWLIDRVSKHAICVFPKKDGDHKRVAPPSARVRAVLELGSWPGLRHLVGVIEAPSMRPDGTLIQAPGYDPDTQTLYAPNATYPSIPESPSQSDAVRAYAHLSDLFIDFPYVAQEHRSATVAAILTLVARSAIRGSVPCWVFDASSSRAGKSLQLDVIGLVCFGRPMSRMTFPVDDDKELESILSSYALGGARVVPFDDVSTAFGGSPLNKVITAHDTVDLRVLGHTELRTFPWRAVVLASGNNFTFKRDMPARVLAPRIEPAEENPETRTAFRHGAADELRAYALERRTGLVTDALTILRAYVAAGRPRPATLGRWGGFDAWVDLVAAALVWAGAPSPLGARRGQTGDEDPTRQSEAALLIGWERACREAGEKSLTVSRLLGHVYPAPGPSDPPDAYGELREALEFLCGGMPGKAPSSKRVGEAVRKMRASTRAGRRFESDGLSCGVSRWRVVSPTT